MGWFVYVFQREQQWRMRAVAKAVVLILAGQHSAVRKCFASLQGGSAALTLRGRLGRRRGKLLYMLCSLPERNIVADKDANPFWTSRGWRTLCLRHRKRPRNQSGSWNICFILFWKTLCNHVNFSGMSLHFLRIGLKLFLFQCTFPMLLLSFLSWWPIRYGRDVSLSRSFQQLSAMLQYRSYMQKSPIPAWTDMYRSIHHHIIYISCKNKVSSPFGVNSWWLFKGLAEEIKTTIEAAITEVAKGCCKGVIEVILPHPSNRWA